MPNAGFFEDVVFEDPSLLQASHDSDLTEAVGETSIDQHNNPKGDGQILFCVFLGFLLLLLVEVWFVENLDKHEVVPKSKPVFQSVIG